MFRDIIARICLYDPGFASDSPVAVIKRIVEDEIKKQRTMELAEVTSIYPHNKTDDNDNYECDVKLKNGGNELRKVPVMTPHIGMAWVPNIGDLVLIGYIGGNVNSPVVIGSLYNDDQRPPVNKADRSVQVLPDDIELKQDYMGGRERHGFEWDVGGMVCAIVKDAEQPSIRMMTVRDYVNNTLHVTFGASDKDGLVRLKSAGKIVIGVASDLKSLPNEDNIKQDIFIKADNDVIVECGGALTLRAGSIALSGDVTISGGSIKVKGSQIDLEGDTVNINGSGTTTIKGGVVKIN